jgi:hypothetical protein
MAEIFKLYKDNKICKNGIEKPYVFSDNLMKGHTPIIIYESSDWLPNHSNSSIYDKLQFQNSYIRYTNCELYEGNTVYITGSFLLGSIYSILIIINRVLKTVNKESKFSLNLTIKGNQRVMFLIQKQLMDIEASFLENYYLEKDKEYKIEYIFNKFDQEELNKFTNKFLGLFVSENKKSRTPFLSVTINQTAPFHDFLIFKDKYLVIGN